MSSSDHPPPSARPVSAPRCRACAGELLALFDGTVLGDIAVTYFRCASCMTLQLPAPHWLQRAYSQPQRPDPDTGRLMRAQMLHRIIRRLRAAGHLSRPVRALDEGAGFGLLVRLLRDAGVEAWGHDPYAQPVMAEPFILPTVPEGKFQLICASEVIEHTESPREFVAGLAGRLDDNGVMILTTELYQPEQHADVSQWAYLAPEWGQHITLLSAEGLRAVAASAGLQWWTSLEFAGSRCVHLLGRRTPSRWARWRLQRRHSRGEARLKRDKNV